MVKLSYLENKIPQLFHAPFTCSFAVRLTAAWGDVALDVLPVKLGRTETKIEKQLLSVNPVGQVSTMVLPDASVLTETSVCLIWVQSQSENRDFRRDPNSAEYFQMLRWISFCSTELHSKLLRIVFYDEATEAVKENFRNLAKPRLHRLDTHLENRKTLVGKSYSAADAYLAWFLTLAPKAGVAFSSYKNLTAYFETLHQDGTLDSLLIEDAALRSSLTT